MFKQLPKLKTLEFSLNIPLSDEEVSKISKGLLNGFHELKCLKLENLRFQNKEGIEEFF